MLKAVAFIVGKSENSAAQNFFIHFSIDNYNANISLYTSSYPKLKFGWLKLYKIMFALQLTMKKWIKKILDDPEKYLSMP